jgi:uncharacterized spore protein YtfJ
MNGAVNDLMQTVLKEAEARLQTLQRLLSTADATKVFGAPVSSGEYTVIPAAEVTAGGGFGSGMGASPAARRWKHRGEEAPAPQVAAGATEADPDEVQGAGGGGGGGGGAIGRPVAAIVVGPNGVEVKPVVDVTKIVLTALGVFTATVAVSLKLLKK